MSTQATYQGLNGRYAEKGAPDRVLALVHDILTRRSAPPARAILLDDDLRDVGLTSLDIVNLMLAVEGEFELKIPDSEMTLANFRSISAIHSLVSALTKR